MLEPAPKHIAKDEYHRLFKKVYNKRLNYVLNVNIILSIILIFLLDLPHASSLASWNQILVSLFVKGPLFFTALTMIRQVRKGFSTVEYSLHKTLATQVYHALFSKAFIHITLFHVVSAILFYGVFIFNLPFTFDYYLVSKEYRQNPQLNDEWVQYWVSSIMLAAFYSANQLVFQRNRLCFEIGNFRNKLEKTLFSHVPQAVGNALGLNIVFTFASPFIHWIIKPYLYKVLFPLALLGIDTTLPPRNTTFTTYFKVAYLSFIVLLSWEFANHVFDVYATIGCLDGDKPISSYSPEPLKCLISGLSNVSSTHELSRLTAFQELSYLATSRDKEAIKMRLALFSARGKKEDIWPAFYEECSLVIREASDAISHRSLHDIKARDVGKKVRYLDEDEDDSKIFGNSYTYSSLRSTTSSGTSSGTDSGARGTTTRGNIARSNEKSSDNTKRSIENKLWHIWNKEVTLPLQSLIKTYVPPTIRKQIASFKIDTVIYEYKNQFLQTKAGLIFRITVKRDAESRVRNPVNVGNAIISLSNLLQRSVEEDLWAIVSPADITLTLNIFERIVSTSTNYIDLPPASIYTKGQSRKLLIYHIRNLTMHEFYELCVQFNSQLNDLNLSQKTYKLAKWVIDIVIAEKQQSERRGLAI